jgi:DNA-binding NarL/FixJ family response regulator
MHPSIGCVAERLAMDEPSVRRHLFAVYRKTGVCSHTELLLRLAELHRR